MKNFIVLFCIGFLVTSCDDGDIIVIDLDFENTFQTCGELVFYKTKTDPAESLSIYIDDLSIDEIIETEYRDTNLVYVDLVSPVIERTLNGSTKKINYRTYSELPTDPFCSDVPSSQLNIINDGIGTGDLVITTTLTEDDNDGIPAELEDINGNGDLDDDDTDSDGVPNYLDDDDDGDNVKTIDEFHNYTEALGLSNALNTDDDIDDIPNYLDNDDDGDGVPTREERSLLPSEHNPANNTTNQEVGADYLNRDVAISIPETVYRTHVISQTFQVKIEIFNLSIPTLSQDYLDFGTLSDTSITSDTRNPTTIFN